MAYTKEELGYHNNDDLEVLHWKDTTLRNKAERYLERHGILHYRWLVPGTLPDGNYGLLMRISDAAKIKPSYDDISGIKSNLLT